jgi:starch synthase (maltosyl-transferring)
VRIDNDFAPQNKGALVPEKATAKSRNPHPRRAAPRADIPPEAPPPETANAPRLYYLNPLLLGPLGAPAWGARLGQIHAMGFTGVLLAWPFRGTAGDPLCAYDHDHLHPALGDTLATEAGLQRIASACAQHGLACLLDLVIDRAAAGGALAAALPTCWQPASAPWLDPREIARFGTLRADFGTAAARAQFLEFWHARLLNWKASGITGVRCHAAEAVPLDLWAEVLAPFRADGGFTLGWLPGRPRGELIAAARGFGWLASSVAWWDGRAAWLAEEYRALRPHGHLLGCPEDPFGPRRAPGTLAAHRLALHAASTLADGWLLPMGFEYGASTPFLAAEDDAEAFAALAAAPPFDLSDEITAANARLAALPPATTLRQHSSPSDPVTVIQRKAADGPGTLVVLNTDLAQPAPAPVRSIAARLGAVPEADPPELPPGGGAVAHLSAADAVRAAAPPVPRAAPRIVIEAVAPAVEHGRFPVKACVGDRITVSADIFADGHEVLSAELRWRPVDSEAWCTAPMREGMNDRWQASFTPIRPGRHVFAIEAWWDHFATFRRDLATKRDAGLDLALEVAEGRTLLHHALPTAPPDAAREINTALTAEDAVSALLAAQLAAAMQQADPRPFATGRDTLWPVQADREAARFASWYELFPRSTTDNPARHGTFRDVIARLPAIRAMGFDVLYFPPIHPIGHSNRKGPNNSLTPGPTDPGSPYAIGNETGGHDAIHAELGTPEDFRTLVREAAAQGLEVALDFAIQCAPDHPWLREHPDWFRWRPDGSMKYAENPPKKYQDIVNVDFYAPDAVPALWLALRDVVRHWMDQGVRIFRVDNPHTKPFPFWEWLIADIHARDPGVLFLAEAFTRPKVMYRLGKVGFSQSYTYFTWRNEKAEITAYLQELNEAPVRDLFRPNFFVNTPDINPVFLQTSGRPGFLIRAALATTLSGLWGMYSGFEICEAAALPGREEYLDSEKYQIRVRDYAAPGNIVAEITRLNEIRRSHAALQTHLGVSFHSADSGQILLYAKHQPGAAELILVAVNLDPHNTHTANIEVPLWELDLPDHATVAVEELMRGHRFSWAGKRQSITLNPADIPFCIWRIAPSGEPAR